MSQYKKKSRDNNNAPVVIAAGNGLIGNTVAEIAEEGGTPIYREDSLTIMLSQLEIGDAVPTELFSSLVNIYTYFLNFKPSNGE